jgi:hypothetical protein
MSESNACSSLSSSISSSSSFASIETSSPNSSSLRTSDQTVNQQQQQQQPSNDDNRYSGENCTKNNSNILELFNNYLQMKNKQTNEMNIDFSNQNNNNNNVIPSLFTSLPSNQTISPSTLVTAATVLLNPYLYMVLQSLVQTTPQMTFQTVLSQLNQCNSNQNSQFERQSTLESPKLAFKRKTHLSHCFMNDLTRQTYDPNSSFSIGNNEQQQQQQSSKPVIRKTKINFGDISDLIN